MYLSGSYQSTEVLSLVIKIYYSPPICFHRFLIHTPICTVSSSSPSSGFIFPLFLLYPVPLVLFQPPSLRSLTSPPICVILRNYLSFFCITCIHLSPTSHSFKTPPLSDHQPPPHVPSQSILTHQLLSHPLLYIFILAILPLHFQF